jgi:hypothetical protein
MADEPILHQRPLAPLRLLLRRRLSTALHPDHFFAASGAALSPQLVKAARGPSSHAARSASFRLAHRALVLALTLGYTRPARSGRLSVHI